MTSEHAAHPMVGFITNDRKCRIWDHFMLVTGLSFKLILYDLLENKFRSFPHDFSGIVPTTAPVEAGHP